MFFFSLFFLHLTLIFNTHRTQSNTFLSITNVENNSQRSRDVVDYPFSELREMSSDEDEYMNHGAVTSRATDNIIDDDLASYEFNTIEEQEEFSLSEDSQTETSYSSSGNSLEDTEIMSSDDEFDIIATKGRSRAVTTTKTAKKKTPAKAKPKAEPKKGKAKAIEKPRQRILPTRAARASSVRF